MSPSSLPDKLMSRAFPAHQANPVVSWSQPGKAKVPLKSLSHKHKLLTNHAHMIHADENTKTVNQSQRLSTNKCIHYLKRRPCDKKTVVGVVESHCF